MRSVLLSLNQLELVLLKVWGSVVQGAGGLSREKARRKVKETQLSWCWHWSKAAFDSLTFKLGLWSEGLADWLLSRRGPSLIGWLSAAGGCP